MGLRTRHQTTLASRPITRGKSRPGEPPPSECSRTHGDQPRSRRDSPADLSPSPCSLQLTQSGRRPRHLCLALAGLSVLQSRPLSLPAHSRAAWGSQRTHARSAVSSVPPFPCEHRTHAAHAGARVAPKSALPTHAFLPPPPPPPSVCPATTRAPVSIQCRCSRLRISQCTIQALVPSLCMYACTPSAAPSNVESKPPSARHAGDEHGARSLLFRTPVHLPCIAYVSV